jgi:hypothetical protein
MFNHGNNLCILFGCRDEVDGLHAPILLHLAEEDEFISKAAQAKIKAARTNKPNATVPVQGWRHVLEECGRLPSLVRSSGDPLSRDSLHLMVRQRTGVMRVIMPAVRSTGQPRRGVCRRRR